MRTASFFDSRNDAGDMRLQILNDKEGVRRCRTVFNCTEVCPRGIKVNERGWGTGHLGDLREVRGLRSQTEKVRPGRAQSEKFL